MAVAIKDLSVLGWDVFSQCRRDLSCDLCIKERGSREAFSVEVKRSESCRSGSYNFGNNSRTTGKGRGRRGGLNFKEFDWFFASIGTETETYQSFFIPAEVVGSRTLLNMSADWKKSPLYEYAILAS